MPELESIRTRDAAGRTFLLLGGTGFLGTNLASRLDGAGHRVFVAGRRVAARDGRPAVSIALHDTATLIAFIRAERIDSVVHLACGLLPSSTVEEYYSEVQNIFLPTIRLSRELAAVGVGLTFLSSGGTIYGAKTNAFAAEDDRCEPISLYGQAKLELERHLSFLARTCGLRLLIVRPSNPFGTHQARGGTQGLISVILGRIAHDIPLDVWGDGSAVRDYIYIDDATDAIGALIERKVEGIVNVGSGVGHSLLEVVDCVREVTGRPIPLQFRPARAADVPRLVLDVDRLTNLGLNHARPLADGIRRYAAALGLAHG